MIRNIYIQIPVFHSRKYNYQKLPKDDSKTVSFSSEVEDDQYIIYANILINNHLSYDDVDQRTVHSILREIMENYSSDLNTISGEELSRLEDVLYKLIPLTTSADEYMGLITIVRELESEDRPLLVNMFKQIRKMGYVSLNNWAGSLEKIDDFQYDANIRSQIEQTGTLERRAYIYSENGLVEVNLNIDENLNSLYKLLNMQGGDKVLTFMNTKFYPDSSVEDIPTDAILKAE